MRPLWKKALAAVAAKQVWDAVQERRNRPSTAARVGKVGLLVALGAGVAYLVKSNRLQPLIESIRGGSEESAPTYHGTGNGATQTTTAGV